MSAALYQGGISPWRMQIAMLPVRREWPDDKRNKPAATGLAKGIDRQKDLARRNVEAIRKAIATPRPIRQICAQTGLTRDTALKHLCAMEERGEATRTKRSKTYFWKALG